MKNPPYSCGMKKTTYLLRILDVADNQVLNWQSGSLLAVTKWLHTQELEKVPNYQKIRRELEKDCWSTCVLDNGGHPLSILITPYNEY
jgi:hypothetical protein